MSVSVTHTFVSGKADGGDATLVQPSDWNAALTTAMATGKLLGRTTAATGAFEEITPSGDFTFTAGALSLVNPALTLGQIVALGNCWAFR